MNLFGRTDIILETQRNNYEKVEELIKTINIDYKDKNHKTALFYAIENDNLRIIDLLIKNGARVDIKDDRGLLPIHYVIIKNNKNIIEYFMDNKLVLDIEEVKYEVRNISIEDNRCFLRFLKKIF